ncbi:DUF2927 domain-containing protein [Paroceanicella profunda]|nr:DUF2927 domain-containing protein [Paroceanicella profunda]
MTGVLPLLLALSACERSLEAQYREMGNLLVSVNAMRTDYDPEDAPVTRDMLVRDFETVALHYEQGVDADGNQTTGAPIPLERWNGFARVVLNFDDDADPAEVEETIRWTRNLTRRLTELTGLPITLSRRPAVSVRRGDILVLFVNADSRRMLADLIDGSSDDTRGASRPGGLAADIRDTPPEEICFFFPLADPDTHELDMVLMIMKSETHGLMRLACIHEEITQAMGLYNDDDDVRPSIFNDDEEFALLTRHDELLLRMLYDPALRPGMTAQEIRPLLPAVADRALAADAADPRRAAPDGPAGPDPS